MSPSDFKFLGYLVPEISLEIKDMYFGDLSAKNELSINVEQNFSKEQNRFVEVVLRIKIATQDNNLKINMMIKGGFEANKDMSDEIFKQLYTVNAPAILFPYARAVISTCTAQAGIPQVLLPLVNFTPIKQQETIEAKEVN